jgi:hypothetical protein
MRRYRLCLGVLADVIMGWFLTKKKSGTSKRRKPSVPVRPDWDPQRTLRAVRVILSIAVLVGLGAAWYYGQAGLRRYVSRQTAVLVTPQNVVLADAPRWMSPKLREELQVVVAAPISPDPLDQTSLARAAAALRGNPWVNRVEQLHRYPDGRVVVRAEYRQPIAVVESREGYHLVDAQGVQLPGLYNQGQLKALGMPVIVGVAAPPPPPGRYWGGEELKAGLALVQFLAGEPYLNQVKAIDVGQRDSRDRVRLSLLARQGGVVHWGLPPGQEQAVETPAAVKKQWLAEVYKTRGSIDAGGKIVTLYTAQVFVHTPVADDPASQVRYTSSR